MSAAPNLTDEVLRQYETWLHNELIRVGQERRPGTDRVEVAIDGPARDWHLAHAAPPSTRARHVLAFVNCDWREGGR